MSTHQGKLHILQELCDDLVKGREQAQAERTNLENEYSSACARLSEVHTELDRERRGRADLEDALHSLKQEHFLAVNELQSQWREQVNRLDTELASRNNDVTHLTMENERVTEELHETKSDLAKLETQLETQRSLLNTATKNVSGLEKEYISLESSLRSHSELLNESRAETAAARSAKELAESSLEDVRNQLDEQKRQLVAMDEMRNEAAAVKVHCSTLEQSLTDRDARIDALIEERNHLMQAQETRRQQEEKIRVTLEQAIAERDQRVEDLIQTRDELIRTQQNLQEQKKQAQAAQAQAVAEHQAQFKQLTDKRDELVRVQKEQQAIAASAQTRLENQEITIRQLRENAEQLKSQIKLEQDTRRSTVAPLEQQLADLNSELKECHAQIDSFESSRSELTEQLAELPYLRQQRDRMIIKINTQKATIESAERARAETVEQMKVLEAEIDQLQIELENQFSEVSEREHQEIHTRMQHLVEQRDQAFTETSSLKSEIGALRKELATLRQQMAAPEAVSFKFHQTSDYDEEYGGEMRVDPTLGRIYVKPPKSRDDLKLISGIAEVLERHLNDFGVYTYRQIMEWDETAVQEFSERLPTFKDRIERDDWIGQAGALYRHNHRHAA